MEFVMKAAALAVAAGILSAVIKKNNPEFSLLLGLVCAAVIIYTCLSAAEKTVGFLQTLNDLTGLSPDIFGIVLKAVAVSIVTKGASDICKDAGQSAASSAVELSGSVAVIYLAIPLFEQMISMIQALT